MRPSQGQTAEQPRQLTYEEFLAWCDEDTLAEWVNGDMVMTAPAATRHQTLAGFLAMVLGTYVEHHEVGRILIAPLQMKTGATLPGRAPDVIFLARE